MNKPVLVVVVVLAAISNALVFADPPKRTAVLVDATGTMTEVTDLRFTLFNKGHFYYRHSLLLKTDAMLIEVELEQLISLESKGDEVFEAKYFWNGKEHVSTGVLLAGTFSAKSDFGGFELGSKDLKQLTMTPRPVSVLKKDEKPYLTRNWQKAGLSFGTTISLKNGTQLQVGDLHRNYSYYSSEGYIIGGETRYMSDQNIHFLRGSSVATVTFGMVKTIDFEEDGSMTVTLRDGKKATGKRPESAKEGIDGFTGYYENGAFWIDPKLVKSIDFGIAPPVKK